MANKLCDIIVSVGTYIDKDGKEKSKTERIMTLWTHKGRVWGQMPCHLLPPGLASAAQRVALSYAKQSDKNAAPQYDIQTSLLTESGKPLSWGTESDSGPPSSARGGDSDTELDEVDF